MNNVVEQMYNQFEELKGLVKAERVLGRFDNSFYCPEQQYLWLDALKADDVSGGIAQNSIYICFKIDFKEQKVELHMCGHVYLSPSDKQSEKYKYYVMRSMVEIATDYGVKKFRKQKYKNVQDLANKMNTYYSNVIQALEQYTGGYPYKKGA